MAISPIAIATEGYLNSPLSVSVLGYLTIAVGPAVRIVEGGGGFILTGVPHKWKHPAVQMDELMEQIRREDEEILIIIMAAMRYLQ